jgi:CubicO group peptidase (beta-lactamase class C family)
VILALVRAPGYPSRNKFYPNFLVRIFVLLQVRETNSKKISKSAGSIKMKVVAKSLFAKLLFLALVSVSAGVLASGQTVADVDAVVQKAIDAKNIPGAGVAIVRGGKVVLTKGYGSADLESGTLANEKTAFQIASVTKQFTAAGIMLLVEDGKLKLDDTLGKYVSDVPPKWSTVTIRQLLNQISGIPNYTAGGKLLSDKVYTKAEIIGLVKDVPMSFEPRTKWEYSNTNYFLLGMVIEKVSGKSYPDFMRDRVFKPLGMESTVINTSGLKIKNAGVGYNFSGGNWQKTGADPSQPFAAGAIVSTAEDMAKWAIAVGQGKLLSKASWDEILMSGKLADGKQTNYGFGWNIGKMGEVEYIAHSGGIQGFGAYHVRFPADDLSVVVLTNTAGTSTKIANDIAALYLPKVAAALAAQAAAQKAERNAAAIADADPETTTILRGVFEGMLRGEGDPALFSAEFQKIMFPERIKQLKGPLGNEGGLKAFELLSVENPDGTKRRLYRATLESGMKVRVNFALDAQGKIAGANVRPE